MNQGSTKITPDTVCSLLKYPSGDDISLSSVEAFFLTRLDGTTPLETLSNMCGISFEDATALVRKLAERGFVEIKQADTKKKKSSGTLLDILDAEDSTPVGKIIPRPLRQKIRLLYDSVLRGDVDHYKIMGVSRSASAKEIDSAYLRLSKEFHPDKYFGRDIGEYAGMLERIFDALTKARDTLSDPDKRKRYDEILKLADADSVSDDVGDEIVSEKRKVRGDRKFSPLNIKLPSIDKELENEEISDPSLKSLNRSVRKKILSVYRMLPYLSYYELLEIHPKASKEALERAYKYQKQKFSKDNFPPLGGYESRRKKIVQTLDMAFSVLSDFKKRENYDKELKSRGYDFDAMPSGRKVSPVKGKGRKSAAFLETIYKAKVFYERGLRCLSEGDRSGAATNFKLASDLMPKERKYREAFEEVKDALDEVALGNIYKRGLKLEHARDFEGACELYEEALKKGLNTPNLYLGLARVYVALGKDLNKALFYAEKSAALDPSNPQVHCTVGQLLKILGKKKEAKQAFKRALDIDPEHIEASMALKEL